MQAKFKFLLCALLVLGFAVSQGNAQGFDVNVTRNSVAQEGHNQIVGKLELSSGAEADDIDIAVPTIATGEMGGIVISYGGLKIANSEANLQAGLGVTCSADIGATTTCVTAADATDAVNVDDDVSLTLSADKTKITIKWGLTVANGIGATDDVITLDGVRVDVSSKKAGDEIMGTISVVGSGDSVDAGGGENSRISTMVSAVKAGLTVPTVTSEMLLTCDSAAKKPTIKVAEGFGSAWEDVGTGSAYSGEATNVFIQVQNAPAGVTFKWPKEVGSAAVKAGDDTKRAAGLSMLTLESAETANSAIYSYSEKETDSPNDGYGHDDTADSFTLVLEAKAGATTVASDTPADVWVNLHPSITSASGRARRLSYAKSPMTDNNDDSTAVPGELVTVGDCVTYLLFPYVTCSGADWTTGFAIANTSKDDMVFGRQLTADEMAKDPDQDRGGATAQSGPVYLYGYPMSPKAAGGASGTVPDGMMTMISSGLSSGDTLAVGCDTAGMSGMDGYAIVEARFQKAEGMAFVLGNFADGAAYDVAHGYKAAVIGTGNKIRN